ncbi:MAG: acetate kinase [Patescibacteria group bacterium]
MQILVLNLGSTSFKFELFNLETLESLQKGDFTISQNSVETVNVEVDRIFRDMLRRIGEIGKIGFVGHRFVHGGVNFFATTKINEDVLRQLEELNNLAPLHNPYNVAGIRSTLKYLPGADSFAVFDTAFYRSLPDRTKIYAIPYIYSEQGMHRFGFHGISHKYAFAQATKQLKKKSEKTKVISVHLGGGCSITAIDNGKPVDTSMGFTPMEGIMMQTRGGDIDPGIIFELIRREAEAGKERPWVEVENILNSGSGIKGVSGQENFLCLLDACKKKDARAVLAFEIFIYRIQKYIGAYLAVLGEVDAIVFTGKIGAGRPETRKAVMGAKFFKKIPSIIVEPQEESAIAGEIKNII